MFRKDVLRNLALFIKERQEIWYKKEILNLPSPWTEDEVLSNGYYTNIYREDDKTTKEIIDIISKTKDDNINQTFNILACHFFNYVPTLEKYFPLDRNSAAEFFKLNFKQSPREVLLTSAILPPRRPKVVAKGDFLSYILFYLNTYKSVCEILYNSLLNSKSAEESVMHITKVFGVGEFRSYELYLTFCYTDWFKFSEEDYVYVGPGAIGVWEMLTKSIPTFENMKIFRDELKKELIEINFRFKKEGDKILFPLRSAEGAMCEYRKYLRIIERNKKYVRRYK